MYSLLLNILQWDTAIQLIKYKPYEVSKTVHSLRELQHRPSTRSQAFVTMFPFTSKTLSNETLRLSWMGYAVQELASEAQERRGDSIAAVWDPFGDLFGSGPTRISGFFHLPSGLHIAAEWVRTPEWKLQFPEKAVSCAINMAREMSLRFDACAQVLPDKQWTNELLRNSYSSKQLAQLQRQVWSSGKLQTCKEEELPERERCCPGSDRWTHKKCERASACTSARNTSTTRQRQQRL